MKRLFQIAVILQFCTASVHGQNSLTKLTSVSDLTTPSDPGFVLADKTPSSIQKPTTPKAVGVSILNLFEGGAFEVTPYWIYNHPNLTATKFYNNPIPAYQTMSLSVATVKTDTSSSITGGIQSKLLRIFSDKRKAAIESARQKIVDDLSNGANIDNTAVSKDIKKLTSLLSQESFSAQIAAAYLGSSKNNSFEGLYATKAGAWLTLDYSPLNQFDILAVVRYSWLTAPKTSMQKDSSYLDCGLGVSYSLDKWKIDLEFLQRVDLVGKNNSQRYGGVLTYQFNDSMGLCASLGKNFDPTNKLFGILGVNFGISNQKVQTSK